MTNESAVAIQAGDLAQIVESVFETMIGLEVRQDPEPWFDGADRLTASVHLSGAWNGAVLMECTRQQACRFAGRFLSIDAPDAVDDTVRDVLGELANMIGGNLKCVVAPGATLSMPSVVNGSDYVVKVCGAAVHEKLNFRCEEGRLWVSVLFSRS